ncbi:excisionase [Klebsiella quasipneumoniae subsp. similipneumoniae]
MSRMVSLLEWAKDEFGSEARLIRRQRQMCIRDRMIAPPPMRVGRRWMVDKEARFIGVVAEPQLPIHVNPKLRRIISDGS